jgi:hypothetical protein
MSTISTEAAVETLWQALDWTRIDSDELFDEIASKLHRLSAFKHMSISQIDLLLADLRRQFVHDVNEYQWRLVQTFKRELEFAEEDAAA